MAWLALAANGTALEITCTGFSIKMKMGCVFDVAYLI